MAKSLAAAVLPLVPLAFLAACSWSDVLLEEAKPVPPASFGYAQGYSHGCKTGIAQNGGLAFDRPPEVRDEARIKAEADYRAGWEAGQRSCADKHSGYVLLRRGLDK